MTVREKAIEAHRQKESLKFDEDWGRLNKVVTTIFGGNTTNGTFGTFSPRWQGCCPEPHFEIEGMVFKLYPIFSQTLLLFSIDGVKVNRLVGNWEDLGKLLLEYNEQKSPKLSQWTKFWKFFVKMHG